MKLNILRIRNAPGEKLAFNINKQVDGIEVNGQEFTFISPVEVTGEIVNQNNLFQVKGVTTATVSTTCANCLEPFEQNLKGLLEESYTQAEDEHSLNPDSEVIGFSGDIIDIEPEVIKSLLLELPMRLVCSNDCRGLCSQCGCNLNVAQCNCQNEIIDHRLAVLKKLQQ